MDFLGGGVGVIDLFLGFCAPKASLNTSMPTSPHEAQMPRKGLPLAVVFQWFSAVWRCFLGVFRRGFPGVFCGFSKVFINCRHPKKARL